MPLMNGISHGAETESIIRDEEDDNERGGGGSEARSAERRTERSPGTAVSPDNFFHLAEPS